MKLHELAARRPSEQVAKVFESHMGTRIDFDRITYKQARTMLNRVRSIVREHRISPSFHFSERNPDYIKLMMMEQALVSRLKETDPITGTDPATDVTTINPNDVAAGARKAAVATGSQGTALNKAMQSAAAGKTLDPQQKKAMAGLTGGLNKMMADPAQASKLQQMLQKTTTAEGKKVRRRLKESEVQQAQVVMAAKDMTDQLQKMLEQISAMQFKDLPALTDAIKNDIGVAQATQFQADSTAALTQLLSSIQQGKIQLEAAQGVITGQAPIVPGDDAGLPPASMDDLGVEPDADLEQLPVDDEEDTADLSVNLGRERR